MILIKAMPGFRFGEDHPKATLTDSEVEQVRRLNESGIGYGRIAAIMDAPKSTIAAICQYRRRPR